MYLYASYVVNLKQVKRARIWENSVSKYQYQLGTIEGFDLGTCVVSPPIHYTQILKSFSQSFINVKSRPFKFNSSSQY